MTVIYKKLFVLRVEQSNRLNNLRVISKYTMPRIHFSIIIKAWVL